MNKKKTIFIFLLFPFILMSQEWEENILTTCDPCGIQAVHSADIDGDFDVLAAFTSGGAAWYENDGSGNFSEKKIISNNPGEHEYVYSDDMDGNGNPDVLTVNDRFGTIAWYSYFPDATNVLCPVGDVTLSSQADVLAFVEDYGSCDTINGSLLINVSPNDLSGLSFLKYITGDLRIENARDLTTLTGLNNLTGIGGTVRIWLNGNLVNVDGLDQLKTIGGDFEISNNVTLTNLIGLKQLSSIEGNLNIASNNNLISLEELDNLSFIGGDLVIDNVDVLTSLDGINGEALNTLNGNLTITNNDALNNIDALLGITTIQGNVNIFNNTVLVTLQGLSDLGSVAGNLDITSNRVLADCKGICTLLDNRERPTNISFNLGKCIDVAAIRLDCASPSCPTESLQLVIPDTVVCRETPISVQVIAPLDLEVDTIYLTINGQAETLAQDTSGIYGTTLNFQTSGGTERRVIKAIVAYSNGCVDSVSQNVDVISNIASFTHSVDGLTVTFSPFPLAQGEIFNYFFAFGDEGNNGLGSNGEEVTYTYSSPGRYNVFFTAIGECMTENSTIPITINPVPEDNQTACTDGNDNDGDGLIDSQDPDCSCFHGSLSNDCCQGITFSVEVSAPTNGLSSVLIRPSEPLPLDDYEAISSIVFEKTTDGFFAQNVPTGAYTCTIRNELIGCDTAFTIMVLSDPACGAVAADFNFELTETSILLEDLSTGPIINFQWTSNLPTEISELTDQATLPPPGTYEICRIVRNACEAENQICKDITITSLCPSGIVEFRSNADVAAFVATYPNCTEIEGNVLFNSTALTSIADLSQLTSIGGDIIIDNTGLSDLAGLENLTTIGSIAITFNSNLTDINLNALEVIEGGFALLENSLLSTISGFPNLTNIGGALSIVGHAQLTSISGFSQLTSLDILQIVSNPLLSSIAGLSALTTIENTIEIVENFVLSACNLEVICAHIATDKATFIEGNGSGCDSNEEISMACATMENVPPFLPDYPWITDKTDLNNCDGTVVTLYRSGIYFYIAIQDNNGYIFYNANGDFWCDQGSGVDCIGFYGDVLVEQWECNPIPVVDADNDGTLASEDIDDNNPCVPVATLDSCNDQPLIPQLYVDYPILNSIVDYSNCNGEKITAYQNARGTIYFFVETENDATLYNEQGAFYCPHSSSYNCIDLFGLTSILGTWECGEAVTDSDQDGIASDTDPDDNDPCNPNPNSITCETVGELPQIFQEYDWLQETTGINPFDCNGEQITVYQSGPHIYLYVEMSTTGNLYYAPSRESICTGSPTFNCPMLYGFTNSIGSWSCGETVTDADNDGTLSDTDPDDNDPCVPSSNATACQAGGILPPIFEQYEWLTQEIDPFDCQGGTVQLVTNGITQFLYVVTNGTRELFIASTTPPLRSYCANGIGLNCLDAYFIDEVLSTWTCGDNILDNDRDGVPSDTDPDDNDPCIPDNTSTACNTGGELPDIFQTYPWLEDFVDPFSCSNERITIYTVGATKYFSIETLNSTVLYQNERTASPHCTSQPNYNCVELFNLTDIEMVWECGNSMMDGSRIASPILPQTDKVIPTTDFVLFPNPTKGRFFVNLTQDDDLAKEKMFRIIDLQGKVIQLMEVDIQLNGPIELDLSSEAAGIYLVQMISEYGIQTKRIMVE